MILEYFSYINLLWLLESIEVELVPPPSANRKYSFYAAETQHSILCNLVDNLIPHQIGWKVNNGGDEVCRLKQQEIFLSFFHRFLSFFFLSPFHLFTISFILSPFLSFTLSFTLLSFCHPFFLSPFHLFSPFSFFHPFFLLSTFLSSFTLSIFFHPFFLLPACFPSFFPLSLIVS